MASRYAKHIAGGGMTSLDAPPSNAFAKSQQKPADKPVVDEKVVKAPEPVSPS